MATYKKRGQKKSATQLQQTAQETQSTTAEVFDSLDTGANKAEEFISKYQNFIIGVIGGGALLVLSYLGYQSFVVAPKPALLLGLIKSISV